MAFPLAAALGFGSSVLGGLFGRSTARQNADAANAFTKEQLQNRHQWEVEDLKKAGLNPMLSAGGTPSIGGSAQAQTPDFASNANSAVSSAASRRLQRQSLDIQKLEAQSRINLNSATAEKEMALAESARSQTDSGYYKAAAGNYVASADQARAHIAYMEKQGIEVGARVKTILNDLENSDKRVKLLESQIREANSSAARNRAQTELNHALANSQGYKDSLSEALTRESTLRGDVSRGGALARTLGTNATQEWNSAVDSLKRGNWLESAFERITRHSPLRGW